MPIELLAVHVDDGNRTAVEFYRWNKKDSQFHIAKGLTCYSSLLFLHCMKRYIPYHISRFSTHHLSDPSDHQDETNRLGWRAEPLR